ncbi:mechanosensitive ion channel family protein [Winogradskyella thalassocola]|uniref:Small-conductance mechanosensitive channel n=1 Tax=Winogradskyella thalassocola TaxID=262004 RepID=A0A1G8BBT7_9FLAO|nr:mechanosensitive ion channel domain-containing protein [Winogradskyella thalassocola]SDH30689.1 Small-conductance mechanosensitive channel [Winogradskyella thalassocola]
MDSIVSKLHLSDLWLKTMLTILVFIGIGLFVQWIIFLVLKVINKKRPTVLKIQILNLLKTPSKFLIPLLFIYGSIGLLDLTEFWKKAIEILIILSFTWNLIAFLQALEVVVKTKFEIEGNHKAKERKVLTQLRFLKSLAFIIIITLAIASILWNIPSVRKVGTTILTSAGVIGIIVGVAAQKSIANLITGFQIAFTQPIKIDDEVEIEGEFGVVEDITLTYVIIKIWDWRRLVLPLSYFNDKPFVNWTFNSKDIIGAVFLYVDYTFPVEELRKEFKTILSNHPKWDNNIAKLLVTKTDQKTMELRATFSAKDSSDIWDLRCDIREKLISFIQENYQDCLPSVRLNNDLRTKL